MRHYCRVYLLSLEDPYDVFCVRTHTLVKKMTKKNSGLVDRIWITERCHMKAEKRKRFLEYYFHVTLALYSLATIAISLFQVGPEGESIEKALIFTSVCTLSISLLIFGFKFGESAAQHRSCYLDLQRLRLKRFKDETDLNESYITTLSYYPNHSATDYMSVIVSNLLRSKQRLSDPNGNPINLTFFQRISHLLQWVLGKSILILFFLFSNILGSLRSRRFGEN